MRFCDVSEVPEKSVFTRLFCLFATVMLANFQDRLVMTASISLRKYDATVCVREAYRTYLLPYYITIKYFICQYDF